MATETREDGKVFLGIYGKAHIGFTATEDGPVWSVDIDTDVDGIWINGCGATLAEAAEKAAEVAQAAAKPFVETTPEFVQKHFTNG